MEDNILRYRIMDIKDSTGGICKKVEKIRRYDNMDVFAIENGKADCPHQAPLILWR